MIYIVCFITLIVGAIIGLIGGLLYSVHLDKKNKKFKYTAIGKNNDRTCENCNYLLKELDEEPCDKCNNYKSNWEAKRNIEEIEVDKKCSNCKDSITPFYNEPCKGCMGNSNWKPI